jgi:hypothetical protein
MSFTLLNNIFGKMAEVNLALSKEIIAITEDRDTAEVLAMDIRDEIQNYDHVDTGKMLDSISVGRSGDPDLPYAVKGVPYLKYVNGYDRENFGGGFVDAAVDSTMSSGYGDIEVMV